MMLLRCLTSSESDDGSCECSAALTKHLIIRNPKPTHLGALHGTERNRGGADLVGCRGRTAGAVDGDAEPGTGIIIGDLG